MTLIRDFVSHFDPSEENHVRWLATLTAESESPGPALARVWDSNPWGIRIEGFKQMQETAEIHFVLMGKYAAAVFKNEAYIPRLHSQGT